MHLVFSSRENKNYWKNRNAKITLTPHSNRWSNESSAMKLIPLIPLSLGDCNHNTRGTHAYALSSVSIIYYWSVPSKTRCYIHIKIHIWSNVDRKITPIKKNYTLYIFEGNNRPQTLRPLQGLLSVRAIDSFVYTMTSCNMASRFCPLQPPVRGGTLPYTPPLM